MDCHRCEHITYAGCRYGRCSHPGHQDVVLRLDKDGKRPYNKQICPDFRLRRKCSNCRYWTRGGYFADGRTPAKKGKCSLSIREQGPCELWKEGKTSWWKRRPKGFPPHGAAGLNRGIGNEKTI